MRPHATGGFFGTPRRLAVYTAMGALRAAEVIGGDDDKTLAGRQAALVEALTSGAPVPPGFDPGLIEAARVALLRKRAGEVAKQWPMLAAGIGPEWQRQFARWAATRPTQGSLRDGWDLARSLAACASLPRLAAAELAAREATLRYDGKTTPRVRRGPAPRRMSGSIAVQLFGRVRVVERS